MKRFHLANAALSLLAGLTAVAALADAPPYVRVRSISYAGTGCPAGSVAQNIASDRQAFTLLFDNYVAEVGPGVPFNQKRKNCQLNIDLDFPQGWSYTLAKVDYRGYVSLEKFATGMQQSSYYFQGQTQTARLKSNLSGPMDKNYTFTDVLGLDAVVWAPCGAHRALNINTEVRTDNAGHPEAHGLITTDSVDGSFKQIYAFSWQHCT